MGVLKLHLSQKSDLAPSQIQLYLPLSSAEPCAPPVGGHADEPLADESTLRSLGVLAGDTMRATVDRSITASFAVGGLPDGVTASVGAGRGGTEPSEQGFEGSVLLGGAAR